MCACGKYGRTGPKASEETNFGEGGRKMPGHGGRRQTGTGNIREAQATRYISGSNVISDIMEKQWWEEGLGKRHGGHGGNTPVLE